MEPITELALQANDMHDLVTTEIDLQIATAKKYPRDLSEVRKTIRDLATVDGETAADCWYVLPPRGKSNVPIDGPAVRLAEITAYAMGNLRFATRIVGISNGYVTAEGAAIDLERNIAAREQVKRRVTMSSSDAVQLTSVVASRIALRNVIFRVMPQAVVQKEMQAIKETAFTWLRETLDKLFGAFEGIGVGETDITRLLEVRSREEMTKTHILQMRGYYTAIKDGDAAVEEIFPWLKSAGKQNSGERLSEGRHELRKQKPAERSEPDSLDEAAEKAVRGTEPKSESDETEDDFKVSVVERSVDPDDASWVYVAEVQDPKGTWAIKEHQVTGSLHCTCHAGRKGNKCRHIERYREIVDSDREVG